MPGPDISVVVPVYGCRDCLQELTRRLLAVLQGMGLDFEVILVNDASPDGAWSLIRELGAADARIKGLQLSRNFGQHHAIAAGLDMAKGAHIVVMDCDLQDDPAEIVPLYAKLGEGYDAVVGRRSARQDNWLKRKTSSAFFRLLSYLTESPIDAGVANFGIYSRQMIRAVRSMGDRIRFFPLMVRWVGYRVAAIEIKHGARHAGKSAYSWLGLFRLALNAALSFSDRPLRDIGSAGIFVSGLAFISACWIFFRAFFCGIAVPGWASVIVSVWFLGGLQMIMVCIVGLYVGRIFDATKNRPIYLVRDTLNFGETPFENSL